ncbi:transmembrane secretion effector [Thermosporothrix hazakensis]|uniref:Transmembrane secretion effector n=2 Tax=Thermosporothrix TaxID=768650 RepID=A0A326UQD3_THEHA|nr:MFS transporter [Thermosporothrix hazakensis]PZW36289.1 transmembrane secretion effector [Thermosporothrix hazakensis]BBH88755.1 MFS transporter [Thermosporothrix sp. COM3]GCE46939.1 MFS transporter [Thermosporothrix hazakensis]
MKFPAFLRKGLLNRSFAWLWAGQTVSAFGSHITALSVALVAQFALHVQSFEYSILMSLEALPVLLFSSLAGVWADHVSRRSLLLWADAGRAALLFLVPLAAFSGWLRIELLYGVVLLVGVLNVLFAVAYQAFLPSLVSEEQLAEGNSKLALSDALAEILGPSLAGVLIQLLTAPFAMLFDACSYLVSAACILFGIRTEAKPEAREEGAGNAFAGWREIWRFPALRALACYVTLRSFCGSAFVLYIPFLIDELHVSSLALGIIISAGGAGALLGSILLSRLVARYRSVSLLLWGALIHTGVNLLNPLLPGSLALTSVLLFGIQLVGDASYAIYSASEITLRQRLVADEYRGRVNACLHLLENGIAPLGMVLAGGIARSVGVRPVLLISSLVALVLGGWLWFSPVRRVRL